VEDGKFLTVRNLAAEAPRPLFISLLSLGAARRLLLFWTGLELIHRISAFGPDEAGRSDGAAFRASAPRRRRRRRRAGLSVRPLRPSILRFNRRGNAFAVAPVVVRLRFRRLVAGLGRSCVHHRGHGLREANSPGRSWGSVLRDLRYLPYSSQTADLCISIFGSIL
jgi:hypothetical protein